VLALRHAVMAEVVVPRRNVEMLYHHGAPTSHILPPDERQNEGGPSARAVATPPSSLQIPRKTGVCMT